MAGKLTSISIRGPSKRALLVMPEKDHISKCVQGKKTYYELDLLTAILHANRSGVYVDVGAHYGNHTTFFALECPSRIVISVEANPTTFIGLRETVSPNNIGGKVRLHNCAIHNTWTRVTATIPDAGNTGSGMVVEDSRGSISACRLDDLLIGIQDIAVIKSDAQYLDDKVILSGMDTIKRCHPLLSIEACTKGEFNILNDMLSPLGYKPSRRYASSPTYLWDVV